MGTFKDNYMSPISPILANWAMEDFELQALNSYASTPPRLWLRYVDDTYVIINISEQENFFEHINIVNSHIKFTQEKYLDNNLAFLDCNIELFIANRTTLTTTYTSPLVHKLGVIRTPHYQADGCQWSTWGHFWKKITSKKPGKTLATPTGRLNEPKNQTKTLKAQLLPAQPLREK